MLILLSSILGMSTQSMQFWWFPAAAGLVGQAVHFATSPDYRCDLRRDGALTAASVSTLLLTVACLLAFAAGRWIAGL